MVNENDHVTPQPDGDDPTLSVGLAVYNGGAFLAEAIDSILAQTFTDFELIISDNASTDDTEAIARRYAAKDGRVRYHRNDANIGGANNENQTFRMARGRYFRWAAHDDVCSPTLFARCVAELDAAPDVVLCYTFATKIDEHGHELGTITDTLGTERTASERFASLARWGHDCEATYGVIRSDAMRRTDLQLNYTDSDRSFLAQLALLGPFTVIPEHLFEKRIHPGMSTLQYPGWRQRMAWFGADHADRVSLPHWMQFRHYLRMIARAPIPVGEKARCFAYLPRWIANDMRWARMGNDVVQAARVLGRRTVGRLRPGRSTAAAGS